MKTLVTVIGTRPQYIKYAAIATELHSNFNNIVIDTGQHYDESLSGNLLREFGLSRADHVLNPHRGSSVRQLADMLVDIHTLLERALLEKRQPDALLCFGDTNSAVAAAMAAAGNNVPIIHVEAGERTVELGGERLPPSRMPEEGNRVTIDHLASLLLCATGRGAANLEREHVTGSIEVTGDIMYDLYLEQSRNSADTGVIPAAFDAQAGKYVFCTVHRAINTDNRDRLHQIVDALCRLPGKVIFPVHPRTGNMLDRFELREKLDDADHVLLTDPLPYGYTHALAANASHVITDSGGLTREAYFGGVPCICVEDGTAWYDLCLSGWCTLTGADSDAILKALEMPKPASRPELFGSGNASPNIVEAIRKFLA